MRGEERRRDERAGQGRAAEENRGRGARGRNEATGHREAVVSPFPRPTIPEASSSV